MANNRLREAWRDCLVIGALNHAALLAAVLLHLHGWGLVACALPLSASLAMGTITVLHDAGHGAFGRRAWPNAVALQLSTPAGLWAGHWGLKHRVHHKLSQVYPYDEATRSSSLVRLHPAADWHPWQPYQQYYAVFAYALAWLGEIRSQLRYLLSGTVTGAPDTPPRVRVLSFVGEKGLWLLVLLPYALGMGVTRLVVLLAVAESLASVLAALVLVVGHINEDLQPADEAPGQAWVAYIVATTASFSLASPAMRFVTGGLTHHLAHHLRPLAPRSELPVLQRTVVADFVESSGVPQSVYPSFRLALRGHFRRLRELGAEQPVTTRQPRTPSPAVSRYEPVV